MFIELGGNRFAEQVVHNLANGRCNIIANRMYGNKRADQC